MKITIDIPEWAKDRNIYIMAGVEGLAVKRAADDFISIKTERCNYCGKCCREPYVAGAFPLDKNGACIYLEQIGPDFNCSLNQERPRVCCYSDPVVTGKPEAEKYCSIRYKPCLHYLM